MTMADITKRPTRAQMIANQKFGGQLWARFADYDGLVRVCAMKLEDDGLSYAEQVEFEVDDQDFWTAGRPDDECVLAFIEGAKEVLAEDERGPLS
jgi:hypothetical protein